MKKKYLIYIPTGLKSPEFEILLSKAQLLINKKFEVEVVTLGSYNNETYTTSSNIFSQKLIQNACMYKRMQGFKMLSGRYKLTFTPKLKNYNKILSKFKYHSIKAINKSTYEGVDIPSAALSSYLGISRDGNLEGEIFKKTIKNLCNTSVNLYLFFKSKIKTTNYYKVILYNARHNEYRPLLRICQKNKIKTSVLEFSGDGEKNIGIRDFGRNLPTDLNNYKKMIYRFWKYVSTKKNKCDYYFKYKRDGKIINDRKSYVLSQDKNLLPREWDSKKRNIVYFTSSQDEYTALGGEYDKTIYKDQNEALRKIIKSFKKKKLKNLCLWVRCHPNLKNVFWQFHKKIFNFNDPKNNIFIIPPESKVSSYKMLLNSEKIINYFSQTGIEAVYWDKPSIGLGRRVYDQLNCIYKPKNHHETMNLILNEKLKPKPKLGALKYASFIVEGGFTYKFFSGSLIKGYKFKNEFIKMNYINKFLYYIGKFKEYYYFNYLINYKLKSLKKHLMIR